MPRRSARDRVSINRRPLCFLGFTFICGKSRRGAFQLKRKTRRDRMRAKLLDIKEELPRRMHHPIPEQGKWLRQIIHGHLAYFAVPTNSRAVRAFRHKVAALWRRTLRRRSQKDGFTWERMEKLVNDWLPKPQILHPWPAVLFAVKPPRKEQRARTGPARICAGLRGNPGSLPRSR